MEWRRTKHHQKRSWESHKKRARQGVLVHNAKVDREGVGETHPTGEMTKSTYLDESKTTKDDKTRYSFEEGEKIPSDLGEYRTACLEERKVDSDGMKMTRADTTGEERNLSKTAGNVEKRRSESRTRRKPALWTTSERGTARGAGESSRKTVP